MKTKLSILTAVLALAGGLTVKAQTVYSLNIVGYCNVVVPANFSIIANPLNATNNSINSLFPSVPNGSTIYRFNTNSCQFVSYNYFFGWGNNSGTNILNPGEGVFFNNVGAAFTNTFVGEVLLGSLTNPVPSGFALLASQVPQSAPLDSTLGFPGANGDTIYRFNPTNQQYASYNYFFGWGGGGAPTLNVGEGFFSYKVGATNWVRSFNPNVP